MFHLLNGPSSKGLGVFNNEHDQSYNVMVIAANVGMWWGDYKAQKALVNSYELRGSNSTCQKPELNQWLKRVWVSKMSSILGNGYMRLTIEMSIIDTKL